MNEEMTTGDDGLCKVETDDPNLCCKLKSPGEVFSKKKKSLGSYVSVNVRWLRKKPVCSGQLPEEGKAPKHPI